MSLDVYLTYPRTPEPGDHVCNCDRCDYGPSATRQVYWRNITHNVSGIASAVGCYKACWRPDENGMEKASQLIEPLATALALLERSPNDYKHLEPSNGWGSVVGFTEFVRSYLDACIKHPDANIYVSR